MTSTTSPPTWIADLAAQVLQEILPLKPLAPIGCHHFHNERTRQHEVTLFASSTETLGGPEDGLRDDSPFCLDLTGLFELFEAVEDFRWQSTPVDHRDQLGSHVSVEGIYREHSVWLRILATPPSDFEHGRVFDVHGAELRDLW